MKSFLILLFTIPFFYMTMEKDTHSIIGKWVGKDKGDIGYFIFDKDGYAFFEMKGQIFGGKEFMYDGRMGKLTYEMDDLKNPLEIDLIITILESGEENRLFCIIQFTDDDTMKFATNFDDVRPKDFNSENSVILLRVK
jgi:hypothetical protein